MSPITVSADVRTDADRHASTLKGLLPKAVDEIKQARAAEEWTYMSHLLDLLANLARGGTLLILSFLF